MRIRIVDPSDAAALALWNGVLRTAFVEGRDGVWWDSDAAVVTQFAVPRPCRRRFAALATDEDGALLGAVDAAQLGDEPVEVSIGVLPEHRRRGIGAALWNAVCDFFPTDVVVQAETSSDAGVAFGVSVGLSVANREHRMLRATATPIEEPAAVPDIEVRTWLGAVPGELVEDWARLTSRMGEDVPVGDLTRREVPADVQRVRENEQRMADQGWILLRSMALAGDSGIGYSLMFIVASGADVIVQDDTFVDAAHRGRGVARILKTANLRALAEVPAAASARWIQTWTATGNAPMLALNESMGFQIADTMFALEGTTHPGALNDSRTLRSV